MPSNGSRHPTDLDGGKKSMTVEKAIDYIMMAIDTKMRKVIFPTNAWFSNIIRPIVPDFVDTRLLKVAKL